MKYITEFRNGDIAKKLAQRIAQIAHPQRTYKLMEFCGGHTHTLHRYGIPQLLPQNVEMIHGPGCPVCVLPMARIDNAIALAQMPNTILCSYGDMLRVPGAHQTNLLKTKAQGADIRMVYSVDDALHIARTHPSKEVIFFAIGFETTTPPTAAAILQAHQEKLTNFFVFCNHVLTPIAMAAILDQQDPEFPVQLDGFVGPAHVSILIGSNAYQTTAQKYNKPIVISGFEPIDVLQSILMLIEMINREEIGVVNQYTRAVTPTGNQKSQAMVNTVFELRPSFEWRGLGWIAHSALQISPVYRHFDAEHRYTLPPSEGKEHRGCECGAILRGQKRPTDCALFITACTPENPLGSCMVSSEGACAAYYAYGPSHIKEKISL